MKYRSSEQWTILLYPASQMKFDAFRSYAASFPKAATLLIDTYDTVTGARKAAEVAKEMADCGQRLKTVRLYSGDLENWASRCVKFSTMLGFRKLRLLEAVA